MPEDETQRYDADAAAAMVVEKANKFEKGDRQFPDSQPRTKEEERELLGSPVYPSKVCVRFEIMMFHVCNLMSSILRYMHACMHAC